MALFAGDADKETYGFKVKLNHVFPEKWEPVVTPRWNQLWELIPLGIRYFFYYIYMWFRRRKPLMDYFNILHAKQMYGVPLGGIGSGTIGRGFKGEFCRYHFRPGFYNHETIPGNQFIVTVRNESGRTLCQTLLSCADLPSDRLQSWKSTLDGSQCEYHGLYPRSWTKFVIPGQDIILTCRQISPVIPHNYKDSCIPGAVFVWDVENNSSEKKLVSITFVFQNGIGDKGDKAPGCWTKVDKIDEGAAAVSIHHKVDDMDYSFWICCKTSILNGPKISYLKTWNPLGDGSDVWVPLLEKGEFPDCDENPSPVTRKNEQLGCAISSRLVLPSNSKEKAEFALVWTMPYIHFQGNSKTYSRYYTHCFWSNEGIPLANHCFNNYPTWETAIEKWQMPVLTDPDLPSWYKSAIFNELYFISDGGSVWLSLDESERKALSSSDPRKEYGRFAYLEGHEYRMYNTYDVHFYASFALACLWPKLQAVIQRDFCDTILREDTSRQWHLFDGKITYRKVKNSIPHDLGEPGEEPFLKLNAYPIHDVSEWRDLNLKFVLQCYRDFSITKDMDQLKSMWNNICVVMKNALRWDKDGDGLIENQGSPDQTYDTWTMQGPSAYCGSLWLAALQCTCAMAYLLGDEPVLKLYKEILKRGKEAFENRLWNGQYYNFDCSGAQKANSIMSDQLCGLWYIKCSGLQNELFPDSNVKSALRKIYEFNVMKLYNGTRGAVNGMCPDGSIDYYTIQSEETWTGVTYALASLMIHEGMVEEGFRTASGIYKTVYEVMGQGYETPEALLRRNAYRAIGYMRALSIWSLQVAWESRKKKNEVDIMDTVD